MSQNQIFTLTQNESERQKQALHLIASDNYPSPKTLALLSSLWEIKYAEGYPGKRYYAGQIYSDQLEEYIQQLALQVFDDTGTYGVNVQTLSGSPANAMVYLSVLEYGDTIMSLNLANGGHLSHLHKTSSWNKFFKHVEYDVIQSQIDGEENENWEVDRNDFERKLEESKPKLVIIGFSAYPRKYEFNELCRLAHAHGALVLADISHISGLVAARLHDSPFKVGPDGADFVTLTTHKTLRGPRGALVFSRHEYLERLNKTVFPGTSGGPHLHVIAAVGQCLQEILGLDVYPDGQDFQVYAQNVLDTCKALENGLKQSGLKIISPTQTHLCLVKLPDQSDSLETQRRLETLGIITNRNLLPNDTKSAWKPSGLRLGTAALASRGLNLEDALILGRNIGLICQNQLSDTQAAVFVADLFEKLNWWY
jgi:glycine hydroxymethyltransferase